MRSTDYIGFLPRYMRSDVSNDTLLKASMILLTFAFLCYSFGVLSELSVGTLKSWHVKLFWLGLYLNSAVQP
ncbi:MAG: hypothetical protein DRN12_02885 [Thermoplasmata archaeon]|nr:MAG: hypothetical protein DRN12_02885 [Thermoplasmata archaeon]HEC89994.1 hypothetical protein [Thermoplasmatales archaeon]